LVHSAAVVDRDLMQRLKEDTTEVHRRLEQRVPIFVSGFDLAVYARLLEGFYGYWFPLEEALSGVPELRDAELALDQRFKARLLEDDFRVFGVDALQVAKCADLPRVDSFARALGCLYVLEGSTLGSVFIARHLFEKFQLDRGSGASFFNAYGGETGARWKQFRQFVGRSASGVCAEEVIAGARETFEKFDEWLAISGFSVSAMESPVAPQLA
jgi:heme oxygenase (biliverdin-IX-beta and delta-forming)